MKNNPCNVSLANSLCAFVSGRNHTKILFSWWARKVDEHGEPVKQLEKPMTTTQQQAQEQASSMRKGDCLIAIIGDEDSVTGFLLAGIGAVDRTKRSNFLIVDNSLARGSDA